MISNNVSHTKAPALPSAEARSEFIDVKNWPEIKKPEKYAGKEAYLRQQAMVCVV
nr:hypothetical protein [Clostridia bacterium]